MKRSRQGQNWQYVLGTKIKIININKMQIKFFFFDIKFIIILKLLHLTCTFIEKTLLLFIRENNMIPSGKLLLFSRYLY